MFARTRFKYDVDPCSLTMPPHNVWDSTLKRVFDIHDKELAIAFESEDVLEGLITMNSEVGMYNKEDLGTAGMKIIDMRVDIEDSIEMVNRSLAKFEMILFSLKNMEAQVRDSLPEFTINYEKYKSMINESRNEIVIDYSDMITED